jgi:hypothetical protein
VTAAAVGGGAAAWVVAGRFAQPTARSMESRTKTVPGVRNVMMRLLLDNDVLGAMLNRGAPRPTSRIRRHHTD